MTLSDLAPYLAGIGVPVVLILVVGYVLLLPDKAEKVAGWIWGGLAKLFGKADKAAVAFKVQGEINTARTAMLKNAPSGLIEGKLKIKWNNAEKAQAVVRDGEVVVFMKRGQHAEYNLVNALMAYLPKALIPRARRYIDPATMQAVDLTVAKGVLGVTDSAPGALHAFYDEHMDPACEDDGVKDRIVEMDEIDLHGWLARVLLPEFRHLGEQMHPGEPTAACLADVEAFSRWLARLAARAPGDDTLPLAYKGRFVRVAVVLVANRHKLADQGVEPYRKQAKRLIYSGEYEGVYLMARDDNIPAVRQLLHLLEGDGRVAQSYVHDFRLRSDFKKRKLSRERGVIACLRPRVRSGLGAPDEDLPEVKVEAFDPAEHIAASKATPVDTPDAA